MKESQKNRINEFALFVSEHRISTLKIPALGIWQASTKRPFMASCRGKTEWLAVRNLARRLGITKGEQL